jgi:hypothetical protein
MHGEHRQESPAGVKLDVPPQMLPEGTVAA